jgi:hypothetical protein
MEENSKEYCMPADKVATAEEVVGELLELRCE